VDVPLAVAARVSIGQDAEVVVGILPDKVFKGRVTRAVHEADVQKNTQQFKVAILDPSPELKPEMLTRVRFLGRPKIAEEAGTGGRTAVYAPLSLLATAGESGQATATVVDTQRGTAAVRGVRLGAGRRDGWAQVLEGLAPGDLLIAEPAGIADGGRVRVSGEARPATSFSAKEAGHAIR